jgi:hypothetical protein
VRRVRREAQRQNGGTELSPVLPLSILSGGEPKAVAFIGCKMNVKKLAGKATGEMRSRPSRRRGWLRDHMASANEADFNLRETGPLPHNNLLIGGVVTVDEVGQRTNLDVSRLLPRLPGIIRVGVSYSVYLAPVRDTAKSRMG